MKELVKLTAPGSEEADPEVYGDFIKDRPQKRRALSIRPEDVEEGLYYLQRNLDKMTADMESDPNFDPGPVQQQIFTMAQDLENGLARLTAPQVSSSQEGGLSEEDIQRLDARVKAFKEEVLALTDTIDIKGQVGPGADTLDLQQVAEVTRRYVRLMEEINKWHEQK